MSQNIITSILTVFFNAVLGGMTIKFVNLLQRRCSPFFGIRMIIHDEFVTTE